MDVINDGAARATRRSPLTTMSVSILCCRSVRLAVNRDTRGKRASRAPSPKKDRWTSGSGAGCRGGRLHDEAVRAR